MQQYCIKKEKKFINLTGIESFAYNNIQLHSINKCVN